MLKCLLFLAFKYYFTPYSRGEELIFPKGDMRNWNYCGRLPLPPPCHPPNTPFSPDTAPLATLPSPSPHAAHICHWCRWFCGPDKGSQRATWGPWVVKCKVCFITIEKSKFACTILWNSVMLNFLSSIRNWEPEWESGARVVQMNIRLLHGNTLCKNLNYYQSKQIGGR